MRVHYKTSRLPHSTAPCNAKTLGPPVPSLNSRHKLEFSARSTADDRLVPRYFSSRSSAFRPCFAAVQIFIPWAPKRSLLLSRDDLFALYASWSAGQKFQVALILCPAYNRDPPVFTVTLYGHGP
ncbi:hypothetical protein BDW75DRAFT_223640 [Aspergillus navahoensis]